MRYLRLDDILRLRTYVAQRDHIQIEVMNQHGLMSALAAPRQSAFGQEAHPTLAGKAAALVHALIQDHPFWDANKRIAALALVRFLELNDVRLAASDADLRDVTAQIARGQLRIPAIQEWLASRVLPLT